MLFNVVIILALIATIVSLGIGLLSMANGGATDRDFGEQLMWTRIGMQGAAVVLIIVAYFVNN